MPVCSADVSIHRLSSSIGNLSGRIGASTGSTGNPACRASDCRASLTRSSGHAAAANCAISDSSRVFIGPSMVGDDAPCVELDPFPVAGGGHSPLHVLLCLQHA